jgi:hypothetical protein
MHKANSIKDKRWPEILTIATVDPPARYGAISLLKSDTDFSVSCMTVCKVTSLTHQSEASHCHLIERSYFMSDCQDADVLGRSHRLWRDSPPFSASFSASSPASESCCR